MVTGKGCATCAGVVGVTRPAPSELLFCDCIGCLSCVHMSCMEPPLPAEPDEWLCDDCADPWMIVGAAAA